MNKRPSGMAQLTSQSYFALALFGLSFRWEADHYGTMRCCVSLESLESSSTRPGRKCFAVIPAAGRSVRMQPHHKLLMDWHGRAVVDHVLDAWTRSAVDRVVIVVRRDDVELQRICRAYESVDVVIPDVDPEDMKRSIGWGLEHLRQSYGPEPPDRWLVAPADLPTLGEELINRVLIASRNAESIVVPRFGGLQGHPVSFPWRLASDVFSLQSEQGINHIVAAQGAVWLDFPAAERPGDIDTPEDYQKLKGQ